MNSEHKNWVNRGHKNRETEVTFLRAFVNHFSFATGLVAKLEGKEDLSIGVNVILNAYIFENCKVVNPEMFHELEESPGHYVLEGSLFQCCDLLSFIAGTYDSQDLRSLHELKHEPPTTFITETWNAKDDDKYEWRLKKRVTWEGVKWLDAAHTGDGGDRACAGIATFTCEKKTVEDVENGEVIKTSGKNHPPFELRRIIQSNMAGPKHSSTYLG